MGRDPLLEAVIMQDYQMVKSLFDGGVYLANIKVASRTPEATMCQLTSLLYLKYRKHVSGLLLFHSPSLCGTNTRTCGVRHVSLSTEV